LAAENERLRRLLHSHGIDPSSEPLTEVDP
jgi:hypothetical protein